MDLEKINNGYIKLKNYLEKSSNELKDLQTRTSYLREDRIIWGGKLLEARRNNDNELAKQAEEAVKIIEAKLKEIKERTEVEKLRYEKIQSQIDRRIETIKQDPEMKKYLDDTVLRMYKRKVTKIEEEKAQKVEEKNKFLSLQQLLYEHPVLANNYRGILSSLEAGKNLNEELSKLDPKDISRKVEIDNFLFPAQVDRYKRNMSNLLEYVEKHGINLSEDDIIKFSENLVKEGLISDKKGNIDLVKTMNKNISGLDRQIKGYDKSIRDHQTAIAKIEGTRQVSEPIQFATPQSPAPQVEYEEQPVQAPQVEYEVPAVQAPQVENEEQPVQAPQVGYEEPAGQAPQEVYNEPVSHVEYFQQEGPEKPVEYKEPIINEMPNEMDAEVKTEEKTSIKEKWHKFVEKIKNFGWKKKPKRLPRYEQEQISLDRKMPEQVGAVQVPAREVNPKRRMAQEQYNQQPVNQEQYAQEPINQEQNTPGQVNQEQNTPEPVIQEQYAQEPVSQEQNTPEPVNQEPTVSEPVSEKNEFANSLKYDIVKDVVNQVKTDNLKEAKKERKSDDMER